jgi:hypothetical protein
MNIKILASKQLTAMMVVLQGSLSAANTLCCGKGLMASINERLHMPAWKCLPVAWPLVHRCFIPRP